MANTEMIAVHAYRTQENDLEFESFLADDTPRHFRFIVIDAVPVK
jgi:hypothetical protein